MPDTENFIASASWGRSRAVLSPRLPSKSALLALGERMLRTARQRHEPLSLLVLQVPDLAELEIVFGRDAANEAVNAIMKVISVVAGPRGLVGRTTPDSFAVVVPRCTAETLEGALRERLGQAFSIELDFDEEEIVLVPDVQARTVAEGDTFAKTFSVLCRAIESQRYMEELRRNYLRREREAHSTHMGLPRELAPTAAVPASRVWHSTIPATIAMPMHRE